TNAGIIGVSRLTFSMGLHQQLPPVLSRIHRRFRTPYVSIAVFSVIAAILIIPGRITFLAEMYVFGAVLAFAMAHVSIIAMRIRRPDLPRPWMIPGNITIRGAKIPITAVLGGLGTSITWAIIVYTRAAGRWIGLTWLAIGIIGYLLYRRSKGLPITRTVRREVRF
ncbi:MAG TPA: amino acid permease, partial [Armatimonadota bacterium]|nr:amino acid permease [Armatimonadota bacterium]